MSKPTEKIGLLLPSREALLWADSDLAFIVDAARRAEQAGYDSVWAGDSLLARPRGEPLTLLAAVAGATTRLTLGTAVLLPLLRHPLSLAHALATLDRIAQGRLIVAVGPGAELPGTHAELTAVGVPSDRRVNAMLGEVERIKRLWSNEEPGIQLQPTPFQPGGPPVWLGGGGPRMLRLAGTTFDGWLPLSPTADAYAAGLRAVREAAVEAGRDPDSIPAGVYLTFAVADTAREAAGELDEYTKAYYGQPAEVMAKQMACHAGTLESAGEWFASYRAAGAQHLVLRLARPGLRDYNATVRRLLDAAR
jgi:alkanesulfonate monooxygenase SsuD/methylene tetrahydromethanopterin reductase-like flavin-dependent oxidoreductase (luciferase family)